MVKFPPFSRFPQYLLHPSLLLSDLPHPLFLLLFLLPLPSRQGKESPKEVASPSPGVPPPSFSSPPSSSSSPPESGYLQAVDSEGAPLCLSCQQACSSEGGPWDTRFCSQRYYALVQFGDLGVLTPGLGTTALVHKVLNITNNTVVMVKCYSTTRGGCSVKVKTIQQLAAGLTCVYPKTYYIIA